MQQAQQFFQQNYKQLLVIVGTTLVYQVFNKTSGSGDDAESNRLKKQFQRLRSKKFREIRKHQLALIPREIIDAENCLIDEVKYLCGRTSQIQQVPHLIQCLGLRSIPTIVSPLLGDNSDHNQLVRGKGYLPRQSFVYKGSYVLSKNVYSSSLQLSHPTSWLLAGPRKHLYFQPQQVKAAIVTCGGLCPGLNVVIREIYINLNIHYGCSEIYGIPFGYHGIYNEEVPWRKIDLDLIRNIQFSGGTFLGSSRGGFKSDLMIKSLIEKGINQLYVIGGDGTHHGILNLFNEIQARKLQISIIGVPKTIDNDIPIIDKSFGFETSVSESIRAIRSAYVESIGAEYGIGLVRLMGRDAGFIAMDATNASRDVDLCLIPQNKYDLYGEHGVLEFVHKKIQQRGHLVIVVAEGAGLGAQDLDKFASDDIQVDEYGHKRLPDIGGFLKKQIVRYSKQKGIKITLKYIDPTYMIRTVPANSHDVAMCSHLAACAAHGAMAGFTGFTVGHVNGNVAMIPVKALENKKNRVNLESHSWQRVLAGTGQPNFMKPQQS